MKQFLVEIPAHPKNIRRIQCAYSLASLAILMENGKVEPCSIREIDEKEDLLLREKEGVLVGLSNIPEPLMQNNWTPEVTSLCQRMLDAGMTLTKAGNGKDSYKWTGVMDEFVQYLCACDEAYIYYTHGGKKHSVYLVLGNCPGELVCDYTINPLMDAVCDQHANEWEGKPQPKKTVRYNWA